MTLCYEDSLESSGGLGSPPYLKLLTRSPTYTLTWGPCCSNPDTPTVWHNEDGRLLPLLTESSLLKSTFTHPGSENSSLCCLQQQMSEMLCSLTADASTPWKSRCQAVFPAAFLHDQLWSVVKDSGKLLQERSAEPHISSSGSPDVVCTLQSPLAVSKEVRVCTSLPQRLQATVESTAGEI